MIPTSQQTKQTVIRGPDNRPLHVTPEMTEEVLVDEQTGATVFIQGTHHIRTVTGHVVPGNSPLFQCLACGTGPHAQETVRFCSRCAKLCCHACIRKEQQAATDGTTAEVTFCPSCHEKFTKKRFWKAFWAWLLNIN